MTKPVLTDPRRTGMSSGLSFGASAGDGLEMPVLFQLTDQTQFKVLTPQAAPKSERKAAPKEPSLAPPVGMPHDAAGAPRSVGAVIAPPEASPLTSPAAPSALVQPLVPGLSGSKEPVTTPVPDSPTIRERAQMRQRRQAAAKGDWFQSQGKYIIVVFVLALAGTIYAARLRDDSPPAPAKGLRSGDLATVATEPLPDSHAPVLDEQPQLTSETNASPQADENPAATADTVAETNPAAGADLPEASADNSLPDSHAGKESPQVNLEAPLASQADSPAAPSPDESLFPWATSREERVASRPQPESTSSSVPMPRANPHYQRRSPTAGVAAPATPSPASGSPAAQSPPATGTELPTAAMYPITDPATYRNYQMEAQRWPASTGAAPATYENRVPTAPRPSGPRYERTGSGLY